MNRKNYYKINKDLLLSYQKSYYIRNKDKIKEYNRLYYLKRKKHKQDDKIVKISNSKDRLWVYFN